MTAPRRTSFLLLQVLLLLGAVVCDFDGNPYRILGVKRTASQAEIKAAYRKKARETHPDKNPENQERAEKMFRDVAGAYELLSDDAARRRYDQTGQTGSGRQNHQQRQQHDFRWQQAHFHHHQRQQQEQHARYRQQQRQRQRESAQQMKIRRAQERCMWINSLSQLRNVALDDDTGRVDKHLLLALFSHSGDCETRMLNHVMFPYPFAHMSDDHGIWWEDVLQTARALLTEQGRPDAPLSAIGAKFKLKPPTREGGGGCPTYLFWRKGAKLNQPEVMDGFRSNDDFQRWVWEFLKVNVQFRNEHPHDVRMDWIRDGRSGDSWTVKAKAIDRRRVFLSHLFAARDVRVEGEKINKDTSLLWHHVRAGVGEDGTAPDEDYVVVIKSRVTDMHTECKNWAARGECRKNRNYMSKSCRISCKFTARDEL